MFRSAFNGASSVIGQILRQKITHPTSLICANQVMKVQQPLFTEKKNYSTFNGDMSSNKSSFLQPTTTPILDLTRSLTKFSLQKGKRKTVKAVLRRFYRLDWGIWIRGKCGRQKKLYKKSANRKRRLRQHVFTNATQSWLLDSMVTKFWRKKKYYVDDPYEPYHKREEFPFTRRAPKLPVQN